MLSEENKFAEIIKDIDNNFEKLKSLEKDLNENSNNLNKYFESYPYLFTIIYLTNRKYQNDINDLSEFILSDDPNNKTVYTYSLFRYFCNENIYDKKEKYYYYDKEIFNKLPLVFKIMNILLNEVKNLNENYSIILNYEKGYYYSDFLDKNFDQITFYPTIWFQKYFLIPIYKGIYDNELERLSKQCLMELKLK